MIFRISCATNFEDQFKLLQVVEENPANIFPRHCGAYSEFESGRLTQHVDGTDRVCLDGLDWVVHVMRR